MKNFEQTVESTLARFFAGILGGIFAAVVVGVGVPFAVSQLYIATGGDPTAAGAFSFIPILSVPVCFIGGAVAADFLQSKLEKMR